MYEHERSLVQKYKNKPFVLMGVNCDEPSELKSIVSNNNITWDNWSDGRFGPIVRQWHIQHYPTTILIDHKGIIRAIDLRGEELEQEIDKLVREAQ